jgi:YegS/Rv2252/BmrU family lipid kinase
LDSYYSIHISRVFDRIFDASGPARDCDDRHVKIRAIINPVSGAGMDPHAAERRVALIRDELARRGLQGSIRVTERPGHARDLALAAVDDRTDLLIVWGGDGTLNEVGAAAAGSRTALGIIPAGSGNGLAAALGVPRDPAAALAKAFGARAQPIDVGVIGDRRFLNVAGIGIDARIAVLFNQRSRGSRGKWPYISIGVAEGCRYRSREYVVQLGSEPRPCRALLIAFANGREYGMGASLAPRAELNDGLLDAFVVEDRSVVARFWHARHLASGTVERAPRVITAKVRTAYVESGEPIEFHVDGETGSAMGRLEIGVLPKALLVRA